MSPTAHNEIPLVKIGRELITSAKIVEPLYKRLYVGMAKKLYILNQGFRD